MDSSRHKHERRQSEPQNVYDITLKVLADLMAKEVNRYNEKNTDAEIDGARVPGTN